MKCQCLISSSLLLAIVGCSGKEDGATSLPDGAAPARVSREVTVVRDEAVIAETKRIYEQELDELYSAAMQAVRDQEWLFWEHQQAFHARRDRAATDLEEIMHDESLAAPARAKAAATLLEFNQSEAERFLFEALRSESPALRLAALKELRTVRDTEAELDFQTDDRARVLLSLIDSPDADIQEAAIDLCAHRRIPGTEQRLIEAIRNRRIRNLSDTAMHLAKVAQTPEAVEVLLPHLFSPRPEQYDQWTGYALRELLENPDPAIREPMRQALHAYTLQFPGDRRYDQSLVRDLAATADENSIPVLQDIVANAKDPTSRLYAVQALARLQPQRAVELILDHIRRERPYQSAVEALQKYARPEQADEIIRTIVPAGSPISLTTVRLFLEKLGPTGRQFVEDNYDRLEPSAKMWAMWRFEGHDVSNALGELRAAGVIGESPEDLRSRMHPAGGTNEDASALDTTDPRELTGALAAAGILVFFDAETGTLPCDHHRLIMTFAEATKGRFEPQFPIQIWHQSNEDDYDAPYTVRFLHNGRLYQFAAENFGDWYDVQAVQRALNFALEDAGLPERFLALESDGQVAFFVFADPAAFLPIAKKYGLPTSDDASEAMRKGKEFEQHVLERLQGQ